MLCYRDGLNPSLVVGLAKFGSTFQVHVYSNKLLLHQRNFKKANDSMDYLRKLLYKYRKGRFEG
jgi:hypothetical protein